MLIELNDNNFYKEIQQQIRMDGITRFTTISEEEANYRTNFMDKSTEYLIGYIDYYDNQRMALKGALEDGFDCEPLDIRIAREVYQEKCTPRFRRESSEGSC